MCSEVYFDEALPLVRIVEKLKVPRFRHGFPVCPDKSASNYVNIPGQTAVYDLRHDGDFLFIIQSLDSARP